MLKCETKDVKLESLKTEDIHESPGCKVKIESALHRRRVTAIRTNIKDPLNIQRKEEYERKL